MFRPKTGAKGAAKRKAGQRKVARRPKRTGSSNAQVARVIETTELDCVSHQMYSLYNLNLTQFQRALTVAKGYQYFRIKRVDFKVLPMYDTFDANGATRVPNLYYMIDRLKQLQYANSYKQLEHAGAKPHRLDDKNISFHYSPSALVSILDLQALNPAQFDMVKVSPWLSCRDMNVVGAWVANGVDHTGVVWYADDQGANVIPYRIERRVTFEFKKPAYDVTQAEDINTPALEWA